MLQREGISAEKFKRVIDTDKYLGHWGRMIQTDNSWYKCPEIEACLRNSRTRYEISVSWSE